MSTVHVKYTGPHDEVVITDGQVEKTVANGETVEVSHDLAHGVKGVPLTEEDGTVVDADANVGATGGLLEQTENWELVKAPKSTKADEAAEKETGE
jgi:hypothetical protein